MKNKLQGLQLIINITANPLHDYLLLASQAIAGGIDSIQFRNKGIYTKVIYELAEKIANLCLNFSIPFIINDRLDIAMAIPTSGVHLGQNDIPIHTARKIAGSEMIIGATADSLEQALQSANEGADYIGCGHIYATKTKAKDSPPLGLETLKDICHAAPIPVFAIGGITEHNITEVYATGAHGIAVVSAISDAANPFDQTKKLKGMMNAYRNVNK